MNQRTNTKKITDNLLTTTTLVAILIIIGKMLGFAREAIIAGYFGADADTDAFFFAQSMPSMLFPAVGNSLGMAFTPLYVKSMIEGKEKGDLFASRIINLTIILGICLGIIGIVFSGKIVPLFAPGFSGEQQELAMVLTRISMGAFLFIMLEYILSAILNSNQLFLGAQFAGISYNLTIIIATVILGRDQGVFSLMYTVVAGMAMQVVILLAFCSKKMKYTFMTNPFSREITPLLSAVFPILLGNCVIQLNNIVDKMLGSTLPEGSVSAISYATSLTSLVKGVIITALSTVLFPILSKNTAENDWKGFEKLILQSMQLLSFILIPISIITLIDSQDIVTIVYKRGSFDETAITLTGIVLMCYAPSFLFAGLREVLTRAMFALNDTKTPMINSTIGVLCNIGFSVLLVKYIGIAGIALGTTLSSAIIAILLMISIKRNRKEISYKPMLISVFKQLCSGVIIVILLLASQQFLHIGMPVLRFALDVAVGFVGYIGTLFLLKEESCIRFFGMISNRVRKRNV